MNRICCGVLLGVFVLSACRPSVESISAKPVSSQLFSVTTCRELVNADRLYRNHVYRLERAQSALIKRDAVAITMSVLTGLLLSPMLIVLAQKGYEKEIASANGVIIALEQAQKTKNCP